MRPPEEILKQYWGFDQFRPLQKEIIGSILNNHDTLAILPTGGGKSICFQVPALSVQGICLVITPLIALMKDQVDNLSKKNIPALLIHSGMKRMDVVRILENARDDYFKFLYLSPERLETSLFREYLPALNINFVAVDEAHCISQWGYDFRPSYLRIASLREEIPNVPFLALTASATPAVQKDICQKLLLQSPKIFKQSFERKNLSYSAFKVESKLAKLTEIINKVPGTGIVYCGSRRRTVEIAELLKSQDISAVSYHAGLEAEERNKRQKDWIENKTRIMVSTNAFGMGIDKPDVRMVVHVDIPDCIENYYQEAGRAGRDGLKSYAVLLFDNNDLEELQKLHTKRFPSVDKIRQVYELLVNHLQIPAYMGEYNRYTFNLEEFVAKYKLQASETLYALKALEMDGWIEYNEKNFSSSSVQFNTSRKGLEEYYSTHPQFEDLLLTLLRTYGGIMDYPVFISEKLIAKILKQAESEITERLKRISKMGIIRYNPKEDDPQIVFVKQRVPVSEFQMDEKQYRQRAEIFYERTKEIGDYAISSICRSQLINRYFGEKNINPCGICDNCLQQRNTNINSAEFGIYAGQILDLLANKPRYLEELHNSLKTINKEKTWKVIRFLAGENKIVIDQKGLIRKT